MPPTSSGRPIARLATELRVSGIGQFALGFACLAAALSASDLPPARAIVPFVVAFVAVGALSVRGSRWMRSATTPPAAPDLAVEEPGLTIRRTLVGLAVALLAVAVTSALGPGLSVVLGGVVAAAGAVDIRNYNWARGREAALGADLFRQTGRSPLAGGRRALYTRPTSESTLAT